MRWEFLSESMPGLALAEPPPPPEWLLTRDGAGVLRAGKAGCIAAAGGTGKTGLLCGLALSVATGVPWLGVFEVDRPGPVLLAMGEEDHGEMLRRLYWTAEQMELSALQRSQAAANIMAVPLAGRPCNLLSGGEGEARDSMFLREMREALDGAGSASPTQWSLVILDPLSRFAGYETEASNSAATRFVQAVESLTLCRGNPTVIVAHHTTKGSREENSKGKRKRVTETAVRGASALVDGFRWVATLGEDEHAEDYLWFKVDKSNYSSKGSRVRLRRGRGGALLNAEEF